MRIRLEEERHTASKMPNPANIAFAGGNGYRSDQERGTPMNTFQRTTRPTASLMAELIEGAHKTSTEELSAFMSFPSFSLNSRNLCACSWRMAVIESTDSHVSSCSAMG